MNRQNFRDRIRLQINNTDTASSQSFTDAQLNLYIYQSMIDVQGLIEDLDETYFEEVATGSIAASVATLALPTGFRKLVDLRRTDGGKNIQFLQKDKREYHTPVVLYDYQVNKYLYTLRGSNILFLDPLTEAWDYTLTYTKDLTDFANDSAESVLPLQAQFTVILKSCLLALGGENNASNTIKELYSESKTNLVQYLSKRIKQKPRYVKYIER